MSNRSVRDARHADDRRIVMTRFAAAAAGVLLAATPATAQTRNAVAEAIAMEAHTHARNMVGAAEAMPAEKYSYKAGDQQNTFGDLIAHAAVANNSLCAAAAGEKAPEAAIKGTGDKAALVQQLKESFAYCDQAFPKVDASKLGDEVQMYGRTTTKAWVLFHMALDWGDHYAQAANMLRQNGILPPSAQRRGSGGQ
jgi:uncharacterized damage-inducible protein DinB